MVHWLISLIAFISTTLCLFLWFRDVRRIMGERKSTVESAAGQMEVCRKKAVESNNDPNAVAVLKRSESIYRQAVANYNTALHRPWICLPATLMGFRKKNGGEVTW